MFYKFDRNNLHWTKDKVKNRLFILLFLLSVTISFFIGKYTSVIEIERVIYGNTQTLPIGSQPWVDSFFTKYEKDAELYLSQFDSTPIQAGMLKLAALNAYDSTGIILPVELALAQAQIESSMGTKGRSPKNNPYNIGETDNGTTMWFENTFDGVQAYYFYMCRTYLKCKSLDLLFKNFTNCSNRRYASSTDYEKQVSNQYYYIVEYLNKKNNEKKK